MAKHWKKKFHKKKKKSKKGPYFAPKGPKQSSTYKKYRKYIAPIGIVLLVVILLLPSYIPEEDVTIAYPKDGIGAEIINSFAFPTTLDLAFTVVLLFTIWFGYKSWILRFRLMRRNQKLVRNIVLAALIVIIANKIKPSSPLGIIADWGLFLGALAVIAFGTLLILRAINSINLRSDLNCWGLRIIGAVLILVGFLLLFTSALVVALMASKIILINIFWIGSLCIIIIGFFCEFRSTRRHPMIGIWQ